MFSRLWLREERKETIHKLHTFIHKFKVEPFYAGTHQLNQMNPKGSIVKLYFYLVFFKICPLSE